MLDEAEMKRDEDSSPGSISAWDVKPAPRALSESQGNTAGTRFSLCWRCWAEERKGTFFNFPSVFLHALPGTWMLKLPTPLGAQCHLSSPQSPSSVRKGITPIPLALQAATLCLSLENTRGSKQKAAASPLASLPVCCVHQRPSFPPYCTCTEAIFGQEWRGFVCITGFPPHDLPL